ncbi:MAG: hypothetical protein IKR19_09025 [Acholeplasmatales bacterium]|nr:hypothetical protein [Acholeplasmatales bacterium]
MGKLFEAIGTAAMLEQTAEECAELTQACLKLARKIRKENPTPKDYEILEDNFNEELADVIICCSELEDSSFYNKDIIDKYINEKSNRIELRIKEIYE